MVRMGKITLIMAWAKNQARELLKLILMAELLIKENKFNHDFNEERWFKEWVDGEKLKELEKKLFQARQEKIQLEAELKKSEG